jgi:hypothetical protein
MRCRAGGSSIMIIPTGSFLRPNRELNRAIRELSTLIGNRSGCSTCKVGDASDVIWRPIEYECCYLEVASVG